MITGYHYVPDDFFLPAEDILDAFMLKEEQYKAESFICYYTHGDYVNKPAQANGNFVIERCCIHCSMSKEEATIKVLEALEENAKPAKPKFCPFGKLLQTNRFGSPLLIEGTTYIGLFGSSQSYRRPTMLEGSKPLFVGEHNGKYGIAINPHISNMVIRYNNWLKADWIPTYSAKHYYIRTDDIFGNEWYTSLRTGERFDKDHIPTDAIYFKPLR